MPDLSGTWDKLSRAEKHLNDLESEVDDFIQSNPYPLVREANAEIVAFHFASDMPAIPPVISLVLGDVVHNLRSSLDHFAGAVSGGDVEDRSFPIKRKPPNNKAEFESFVRSKMPNIRPQLLQAICRIEPYRGGNGEHLLVNIDHLDVIDKHRAIIAMSSVIGQIRFTEDPRVIQNTVTGESHIGNILEFREPKPVVADQKLIGLHRLLLDEEQDIKVTFHVAFGEPPSLWLQPLIPTLRLFIDEVQGLLQRLAPLV